MMVATPPVPVRKATESERQFQVYVMKRVEKLEEDKYLNCLLLKAAKSQILNLKDTIKAQEETEKKLRNDHAILLKKYRLLQERRSDEEISNNTTKSKLSSGIKTELEEESDEKLKNLMIRSIEKALVKNEIDSVNFVRDEPEPEPASNLVDHVKKQNKNIAVPESKTQIHNFESNREIKHKNVKMSSDDISKRSKCPFCSKDYSKKGSLNEHIQSYHMGVRFNCYVCHKKFVQKNTLKNHLKRTHEDLKGEYPEWLVNKLN